MFSIQNLGFTIFGGGFFQGFGGPPGSATGCSSCGKDFDAYVKSTLEPFPYNPTGPAARFTEMWQGRKAKIYQSPNQYRIGTVRFWVQRNNGPFSSQTKWTITIKYDAEDGDVKFLSGYPVKIRGKPKKFDGKEGTILSVYPSGKVKVQLKEDPMVFVSVAPENIENQKGKEEIEYLVHRMNITGGGIVDERVRDTSRGAYNTKLSLEWIDEPSPPAPSDLFPNTVNVKCPSCRAVEPNDAAFDDTVELHTNPEMCPICTESKRPSRTLQCGHILCNDCFRQWRDRGDE